MAAGMYANLLAGDCIAVPDRVCFPFKEFSVHALASSPALGTGITTGTFGCGIHDINAGTQLLKAPRIPNAIVKAAPLYGQTTGTVTLPYQFSSAHLAPWRSRNIMQNNIYNDRASGPALKQAHSVTQVRRRLRGTTGQHNKNYQGRNAFPFTDASAPIGGEADWLGMLHPAHYIWTNKGVSEPFLAVDNYEQSGASPTTTDSYNQRFIPFCDPLNAYSSGGTLLGQFIGYTFLFYVAFAYIKYPVPGHKPEDYLVTQPSDPAVPRIYVQPTYQFLSIDCHLFLTASSGSMISPRVNSTRYWIYNKPGQTFNPCDPYWYVLFGAQTAQWNFDVRFTLQGGGSETIRFGISNLNFYIAP